MVALYVIRNNGQFGTLDDGWSDDMSQAAHFLTADAARPYVVTGDQIVRVEYHDDWTVDGKEVVS